MGGVILSPANVPATNPVIGEISEWDQCLCPWERCSTLHGCYLGEALKVLSRSGLNLSGLSVATMAAALPPRSSIRRGDQMEVPQARRGRGRPVGERRGSFCNGKWLSRGFSKNFLSTILLPDESGSQSLDRTVKNQRTLDGIWFAVRRCGRGNPPPPAPPASAGSREP